MNYKAMSTSLRHHLGLCLLLVSAALADGESLSYRLEAASNGDLRKPHDLVLAPDGRHLFVADYGNDRIVVLHPYTLESILSFGEGELDQPHDVAFDRNGRLLVADTGNNRIAIYEIGYRGARLVGEIAEGLRLPMGVETHQDGRVLVTGSDPGRLMVYLDGLIIAEAGGVSQPRDVQIGPDHSIWVADVASDRLVRFDRDLQVAAVLDGSDYAFNGPGYLDFDAQDRMYVADQYNNQVKVIDRAGNMLAIIGTIRAGKGEGLFDRPEGVETVNQDVWISDTYNDRVVRYRVGTH